MIDCLTVLRARGQLFEICLFLGVPDEKVYQGLQTTERSVAELSKGLGEPVKDLIKGAEDP